jgi:hypothetical protein
MPVCRLCSVERMHQLALRMNRNALLAEKRSRLLQAIRQTYNDFFHDYFISGDLCFRLRVRLSFPYSCATVCITLP